MNFQNHTPFAAISWDTVGSDDKWSVSTIARVKYDLIKSDVRNKFDLVLAKDQGDLFGADVYYGEVGKSSVQYESDYISFKFHTDVIVNANAISPFKDGAKAWETSVKIFDDEGSKIVDYPLHIKSEKIYHKAGIVWTPTIRKKATHVPIIYEKAYGGIIQNKHDEYISTNQYNPVGCGIKKIRDTKKYINDVQINYLDTKEKNIPAGYGFIEKSWQSRLNFSATYDDEWLKHRHPLPPKDYHEFYHQSAHPNLILKDYVKNKYKFEFENLKIDNKKFYFMLEKLDVISILKGKIKDTYKEMQIDTIIIDIKDEDESNHCVYVSYRAKIQKKFEVVESTIIILEEKV